MEPDNNTGFLDRRISYGQVLIAATTLVSILGAAIAVTQSWDNAIARIASLERHFVDMQSQLSLLSGQLSELKVQVRFVTQDVRATAANLGAPLPHRLPIPPAIPHSGPRRN